MQIGQDDLAPGGLLLAHDAGDLAIERPGVIIDECDLQHGRHNDRGARSELVDFVQERGQPCRSAGRIDSGLAVVVVVPDQKHDDVRTRRGNPGSDIIKETSRLALIWPDGVASVSLVPQGFCALGADKDKVVAIGGKLVVERLPASPCAVRESPMGRILTRSAARSWEPRREPGEG